jgi:hypothetical protein
MTKVYAAKHSTAAWPPRASANCICCRKDAFGKLSEVSARDTVAAASANTPKNVATSSASGAGGGDDTLEVNNMASQRASHRPISVTVTVIIVSFVEAY